MRDFVAGYCDSRFGESWHLSPDQSLLLRSGERTLPRQLQIWSIAGNNQLVHLPHGCSLFIYRAPALLPAEAHPENQGIRLVNLMDALVAVPSAFFMQQPLAARVALGMVEDTELVLRRPPPPPLLDGSHLSSRAGWQARSAQWPCGLREQHHRYHACRRLHGARSFAVRSAADNTASQPHRLPHVQRLRLNWAAMRESVIAAFPAPGALPADRAQVLRTSKIATWQTPITAVHRGIPRHGRDDRKGPQGRLGSGRRRSPATRRHGGQGLFRNLQARQGLHRQGVAATGKANRTTRAARGARCLVFARSSARGYKPACSSLGTRPDGATAKCSFEAPCTSPARQAAANACPSSSN